METDPEIPKYRKKSKKVTPKKSDHKHVYDKEVLFVMNHHSFLYAHYFYGTLCSICGKRGEERWFECDSDGKMLMPEDVLKKYKHLEIIDWRKYEL